MAEYAGHGKRRHVDRERDILDGRWDGRRRSWRRCWQRKEGGWSTAITRGSGWLVPVLLWLVTLLLWLVPLLLQLVALLLWLETVLLRLVALLPQVVRLWEGHVW